MFKQLKVRQSTMVKATPRIWLLVLLVLASLACSLGRLGEASPRKVVHIQRTLPTFTPTTVAGSPQDVVAAEAPDRQELSDETTLLNPTVTAMAVAQVPPQPANSFTPPDDTSVRFVFIPMVSSQPVNFSATPTPDSLPNPGLASVPTETPAAATPTPPPMPSPNPEPNPVPDGSGWAFIGVQVSYQDEEGAIIDGDIINNTGAPQEIVKLSGTIYDSQGQDIASVDDAAAYWPLEIVPPGGQVPFEMIIYGIQGITDFDLDVVSQPGRENPRQDFELSDLDPSVDGGDYCVTGKLWNRGDPLLDYLLILVVLYDDQDKVVNFGIFQGNSPEEVLNNEALNFDVCADSYNHQIARHELRAVGL